MIQSGKKGEITGRKIALIFCVGFATIITANMTLLYFALGSFPGLEVRNPYAESVSFDTRRQAQEKLNWTSSVSYRDGLLTLLLTEPDGGAVITPNLSLEVRRATSNDMDQKLELEFDGRAYVSRVDLPAGNWQALISAKALDGTDFQRILPLFIRPVQ
jgi:nitrogen fixation protein FixH